MIIEGLSRQPPLEQARLFRRAALVVGPHGAAHANAIFCRPRTPIVEYIAAGRRNSPLYAGLARIFSLTWWAVVANGSDYDSLRVDDVVSTVRLALAPQMRGARRAPPPGSTASRSSLAADERRRVLERHRVILDTDFLLEQS